MENMANKKMKKSEKWSTIYNTREFLHLKGESRSQRKAPFHSAMNKTHTTADVKLLIGASKTYHSGEATYLKYVEVITGGHVFLGHHTILLQKACQDFYPQTTSGHWGHNDSGWSPGKLLWELQGSSQESEVWGTEEMFPSNLPAKSYDTKREKRK